MSRKILTAVLLFEFMGSLCRSQPVGSYFENYTFNEGLSSNDVRCITQDDDGFLWIGTSNGLNRYDGNFFFQYFKSDSGLSENNINDVLSLPHHRVAIATFRGLNFLDTRLNKFSVFRSADTSALAAFSNNFQKLCLDQQGNLWVLTQTDLYVFDPALKLLRTFHSGLSVKDINRKQMAFAWTINLLADGNLMIEHPGFYEILNPHTFKFSTLNNQSESSLKFILRPEFSGIYLSDRFGRFWFLKNGKDSLYQFDFNRNVTRSYALFQGVSKFFGYSSSIYCIDSNHILFHLPNCPFFELAFNESKSQVLRFANLPVSSNDACFATDHQNTAVQGHSNFWIGTKNGLYEWSSFANQFRSVVLQPKVETQQDADNGFIFPWNNKIWIGSYGNGFYNYDPSSEKYVQYNFHFHADDNISSTWSIRNYHDDTFWVGTQAGLIWFVEKANAFGRLPFAHPLALDSFPVTTQFQDSRGLIWIGMGDGHGVIYYDPEKKSFTIYNEKSSPEFPLRHPTAITEDENGNLWMGTQKGGGLVKWDRTLNRFTLISAKQSTVFYNDRINDLYADHRGHIWIGSLVNGLLCYDLSTGRFEAFGKDKGLSHEFIYRIKAAQYPYLWLVTAFGLDRFNMQTGMFEAFYKRDGLPADDLSDGMYYDTATGLMYIGCKTGFIQFDAKQFSVDEMLPNVLITDLSVNDRPLHIDLSKLIRLNYKQNNLTLNFTAVDLVNGSDLKFRYHLSNEKDWSDPGKNRQIHFSNLSAGDYSLLISVANKSGVWNENATALNFSIQPPFWKTSWFYFLIAGLISALIYALYRFRINQLQRVLEMRNRIARDLHDDIGGTMTAMNLTNELAMQHLQEPAVAKKLMQNISDDLKNVGETLDDIVWTVNPKNDSMTEVMARMRRYASRTWETAGIDFSFEFENGVERAQLNMEQRHDLYLAFKEAVNNIAKHAQCTRATASLLLHDHSLTLEVKDDGKGFDVTASSHRNGLRNMQTRMQKWKGTVTLQSSKGKGTQVHLFMPITQKGD